MNIQELVTKLALIGLSSEVRGTGAADWTRVFIRDGDGCSIARASFQNGDLFNIKWYWRSYGPLHPADKPIVQWTVVNYIGRPLTDTEYDELVAKAEALRREDIAQKKAWREANPKFNSEGVAVRRRKLEGRSARAFMYQLIAELKPKELSNEY